jgi:hypothetical protein
MRPLALVICSKLLTWVVRLKAIHNNDPRPRPGACRYALRRAAQVNRGNGWGKRVSVACGGRANRPCGLSAQGCLERAMIRERVLAGLARAKAQGTSLGRPRLEDSDASKVAAIKAALEAKKGIRRIARELKVGVGTVLRLKAA